MSQYERWDWKTAFAVAFFEAGKWEEKRYVFANRDKKTRKIYYTVETVRPYEDFSNIDEVNGW